MTDILNRMQGCENWQRREAAGLREHYSKSPAMPELAEMHEETADALKDARAEIERLRDQIYESIPKWQANELQREIERLR